MWCGLRNEVWHKGAQGHSDTGYSDTVTIVKGAQAHRDPGLMETWSYGLLNSEREGIRRRGHKKTEKQVRTIPLVFLQLFLAI